MGDGEDRRFGELPLAQTVDATARLTLGDTVLAIGKADTVAMPPERMAANRFGQRRTC